MVYIACSIIVACLAFVGYILYCSLSLDKMDKSEKKQRKNQ